MSKYLIENDNFLFEMISKIAERESWRKELNRPMYHLHKWWAKRLGSVFRAILLGCLLPEDADLLKEFYCSHSYPHKTILEPFMGSGTTIGEASKLGLTSFGMDINPVAAETVRVALSPINQELLFNEFKNLEKTIGNHILDSFKSTDLTGNEADVLYYFWVMQSNCINCETTVDLFSDYIIAQNAYPKKKPQIQVLCKFCGNVFSSSNTLNEGTCPSCKNTFDYKKGIVKGKEYTCPNCKTQNSIVKTLKGNKPSFRLYAKLILTKERKKEYLRTSSQDIEKYNGCSVKLAELLNLQVIQVPNLLLEQGHNTQQAINYGFKNWRDFFNDRQLLLLAQLYNEISKIQDESIRNVLFIIFSSTLEFNNLFVSYKGEGTGAVRHMFSHHILKPERIPIEANLWGTNKSSGSFSGIFKSKINKILEYRKNPREVHLVSNHQANYTLTNIKVKIWGEDKIINDGSIYLSCGDSSVMELEDNSIDYIVTDPPFFDNVHYSELADFFFSWLKLNPHGFINKDILSTRHINEVQDADALKFAKKLESVFLECNRVLKNDGFLIFTYHHSKEEGWTSIANSIHNAGFYVENYHPIKSEMSVARPKIQAKEPIQLDIILVCKKLSCKVEHDVISDDFIITKAKHKAKRLVNAGFKLSQNDKKIILYGQLLKSQNKWNDESYLAKLMKKYLKEEVVITA